MVLSNVVINKNIKVTHLLMFSCFSGMHGFSLVLIWSRNCIWYSILRFLYQKKKKQKRSLLQNTENIQYREGIWYISNSKSANYTNNCEWYPVTKKTSTAKTCIFSVSNTEVKQLPFCNEETDFQLVFKSHPFLNGC